MKPFTPDPARLPRSFYAEAAAHGWERWEKICATVPDEPLRDFMQHCQENTSWRALLEALFGNSPYLTRLACAQPRTLLAMQERGPNAALEAILQPLAQLDPGQTLSALMQDLRIAKAKTALLAAVADISQAWNVGEVTQALSKFADLAVQRAVDFQLLAASRRGDIAPVDEAAPAQGSGLIVLGMGKLGAYELNYSSDIDLVFFYEPGKIGYRGRQSEREAFRDIVQGVVHILQERTPHGYVFRTDLRLRPDPSSTPPAVSTEAAMRYYESVGQNWERAAMIKARPIAGDIPAGEEMLHRLSPFLWRRSLDMAAINDILSIKRQMDMRSARNLALPGHNIKIGMGGIREIELFTQIHQLIWGGRMPHLRLRGTCDALKRLSTENIIDAETAATLLTQYPVLRTLEHRLQMVDDQQTHALPTKPEDMEHIAAFMGYTDVQDFSKALLRTLETVHELFVGSFQAPSLSGEGNLVFTGVSHDPGTLETLKSMGFAYPERVSEAIMGWHRGSRRCTRTKRARELLTELVPLILQRLSETIEPDAAFERFDAFLARVPAGMQLFSLFSSNPRLLGLIAGIMGNMPLLAEHVSLHPDMIDAMLYPPFFAVLPTRAELESQLAAALARTKDFEESMEGLRRFKNELQLQTGVQLLQQSITTAGAGAFLTTLADVILQEALKRVEGEFAVAYGRIGLGRFCILGLGRLGSAEMTFGSDIDLIFVYDAPEDALSDGAKSINASLYYNRLAQRALSALSTLGREGRLYETDTRLRPSGADGMPAASMAALKRYFLESAWTFERMALVRARGIAGDASLLAETAAFIKQELTTPRDAESLRADAASMRERVRATYSADNPWDVKYAEGGLMDIDFIAHYLLLAHGHMHPGIVARNTAAILQHLKNAGLLPGELTDTLIHHYAFLTQLLHVLRLSLGKTAPKQNSISPRAGAHVATMMGEADFAALGARLQRIEQEVRACYKTVFTLTGGTP